MKIGTLAEATGTPVETIRFYEREGLLPPVTWITPRFELSEHPEYNFCHGENWTTKVIDAIVRDSRRRYDGISSSPAERVPERTVGP